MSSFLKELELALPGFSGNFAATILAIFVIDFLFLFVVVGFVRRSDWWEQSQENARRRRLLRRCAKKLPEYFRREQASLETDRDPVLDQIIDHNERYVSLVIVKWKGKQHDRGVSERDLLDAESPVLIESGPGHGKTTLLRHLHFLRLNDRAFEPRYSPRSIPVFLSATRIAKAAATEDGAGTRVTFWRRLVAERLEALGRDASDFVEHALEMGWCLLLIDGVDEVSPGEMDLLIDSVHNFLAVAPSCHLVVTSRPIHIDLERLTSTTEFVRVSLAPLTPAQKTALIEKYAASDKARILKAIETPFMVDITRVIMNLVLFIGMIDHLHEIKRRSDFYEKALETLLSLRERKFRQPLNYPPAVKRAFLATLCFDLKANGKEFTMDTVSTANGDATTATAIFAEILSTLGLIKRGPVGTFQWAHQTYAEYLAARRICESFASVTDEQWVRIFRMDGSEVVSFVAELLDDVEPLVSKVFELPCNRPKLLTQCLANCASVTSSTQARAETAILEILDDSAEIQVQSGPARYVLSLIHRFPRRPRGEHETIYQVLLDKLTNPSKFVASLNAPADEVQTQALRLLVHTSSPEIVPDLLHLFDSNDIDTYVLFKAGELLASLSSGDLLPQLERAYTASPDDDVRRFITEAIVRTKSLDAIEMLTDAITSDGDPVIRDLASDGVDYIRRRLYYDERLISVRGVMRPGSDLSIDEVVILALDHTSDHRLEAFFTLRNDYPGDKDEEVFRIAMTAGESEFFRCEAVRLLGRRKTSHFALQLERVFRETQQADPFVGAGARGCAIEYLAHRQQRASVFRCLEGATFDWRTPSERCKIMWAVYEILRASDVPPSAMEESLIRGACIACPSTANARIQHWQVRAEQRLKSLAAGESARASRPHPRMD